jgi:hypothetical protein
MLLYGQTYRWFISYNDTAGNLAKSSILSFTVVDTIVPVIVYSVQNYTIMNSNLDISLSVTDNDEVVNVTYSWDDGNSVTLIEPYLITLPESNGLHTLTILASDNAGNEISQTMIIIIDNIEPIIILESPNNGSHVLTNTIIYVNITDLNLESVIYNWNGEENQTWITPYEVIIPNAEGQHILFVYAKDNADNWSHKSFLFIIDQANDTSDVDTSITTNSTNETQDDDHNIAIYIVIPVIGAIVGVGVTIFMKKRKT